MKMAYMFKLKLYYIMSLEEETRKNIFEQGNNEKKLKKAEVSSFHL